MKLSSSDRKALVKLASSLPKGSAERRAILAGLRSILKTALDFTVGGPDDLSDFSNRTRKAITKHLGRGFKIISPRDNNKINFWQDDPLAPGPFRNGSTTVTLGSDMGTTMVAAVKIDEGGRHGTYYLIAR